MISEFALFVFTTLGGVGAGMYAASAVFPVKSKRDNLLAAIVPLVLLIAGGIALLMHLGHPERILNAFANPSAGITLEAFGSVLFGIILVIDLAIGALKGSTPRLLRIVGALVGVALCIFMGVAYFKYESVAAWHSLSTILLFLCGSLSAGALMMGALSKESRSASCFMPVNVALAALSAVAFLFEGIEFVACGFSFVPFACSTILALGSVAMVAYGYKKGTAWAYWLAFALMFIAVVVARYAFYSVI